MHRRISLAETRSVNSDPRCKARFQVLAAILEIRFISRPCPIRKGNNCKTYKWKSPVRGQTLVVVTLQYWTERVSDMIRWDGDKTP